MTEKLKVGIISAAWGAIAHLPAWRSLDDVEVVAICTSRPETAKEAAEKFGVELAFSDYVAMANDPRIDIVDAGTRPPLRLPMVGAALNGGKHVYAGMPFGMNAAESRQMELLRREKNLIGAVDAFIQATPAARLMRRMIGEGYLGKLSGVRCTFHLQLFTETSVNVPGYAWFADASQGATVLRNLGGHALHAIVSLFGNITEVIGHGRRTLDRWPMPDGSVLHPEIDDNAVALFRLGDGTVGQLSTVWNATDGSGFTLEAWGGKGRLVLHSPTFPQADNTTLSAGLPGGLMDHTLAPVVIPESFKQVRGGSLHADTAPAATFPMATIFRGMVDAIRGGGAAEPGFDQALHVQTVVDAIERSYAERRWVEVPGSL